MKFSRVIIIIIKDLYSTIYKSHPGALTELVTICSREEYSFETAFK